ncbi:MAG: DMT family transporter, partial [Pseudomonadota bacterium]
MGALNNAVPFTLLFWAQTGIGSGLASILNATTPLFTVIVAQFATGDERMTGPKVLGIVLGILGVAILIGRPAAQSPLWAQIAVLGAALSYGCATVFGKRFARLGVAPVMTATGQVTLSSAIMAPLVVWIDRPWAQPMPDASVLAAILALAVVSTAFAYLLFFRILRTAGATNLSLVTLLIPVSAVLLGALFLGEVLSGAQLAGMAVIGAGLLVMDGRLWRWVRS